MNTKKKLLKEGEKVIFGDCEHHDHAPNGECLVLSWESPCGKPHNGNEEAGCLECEAIKQNI